MNPLSPWAISSNAELAEAEDILFEKTAGQFNFKVIAASDSIWIQTQLPGGGSVAFRAAFSPGTLEVKRFKSATSNTAELHLTSAIGTQVVNIVIDDSERTPVLRYTTQLVPARDLAIPAWPKDVLFTGKNGNAEHTAGQVHASQFGTRTGFLYMSQTLPSSATLLYHQNLTALGDYNEQTETSAGDTVGGEWPELGFSLPPSKKPLLAGKAVTITDAFVAFQEGVPKDEATMINSYLELLARVYLCLPRPETNFRPWPEILDKGLKDLINSPGCWSHVNGNNYLNAYLSDHETPPEIMVQLAVLLPLLDYTEWSDTELEVMDTIRKGLPEFYDRELGTIMRWLPAAEDKLDGEEEQKVPKVMDSWYLHHPLLNLSRLALKGDDVAKKLFLDSLDFAVKVAHHFNYKWPVFYKMDTLEVVKEETAEGKGGEKDVAGIYAHVMLQAWELTKEKRFLKEAEKSAKTLQGYGFEVFYQANNTAFSAGALLRLYKITNNELYLNLSYMCLAGIFRNMQLWDCNYGYGKNFPKFFSLFPLNDAPYTAAYEEQEVFCAFHDYLKHAEGVAIMPAVQLLITEYIRYTIDRAPYYYPTMLPVEMLEEEPKMGEVDPQLWIALEDLQDGWLKSGTVGQEVYGAGNAFGILPRHYLHVSGQELMIYADYPFAGYTEKKGKPVEFTIVGDQRLTCRMVVVKTGRRKIPELRVEIKGELLKGKQVTGGNIEFTVPGNSKVKITIKDN
jgi:hypothetical protein